MKRALAALALGAVVALIACKRASSGGDGHVTVLAAHEHAPHSVALDTDSVYWVRLGTDSAPDSYVVKVAKAGGKPVVLAECSAGSPLALTRDEVFFYSASKLSLQRMPKAGGEPSQVVVTALMVDELAIDGGWLYWSETKGIRRMPLAGGAVETLDAEANTEGLTAAGGEVFWSTWGKGGKGSIERAGTARGQVAAVAGLPGALALEGDQLMWVTWWQAEDHGDDVGEIWRVSRGGGAPVLVGRGVYSIAALALHQGRAYVGQVDGPEATSPSWLVELGAGAAPRKLAHFSGPIYALGADDSGIYVAAGDDDGQIARVTR